jgi:hypothetical protein
MYAPRQIRCVVIEVPAEDRSLGRSRIRPSQLLPWSDPYIASLVSKLQDEVRRESGDAAICELETPWNEPFEYEEGDDFDGFSIDLDQLTR